MSTRSVKAAVLQLLRMFLFFFLDDRERGMEGWIKYSKTRVFGWRANFYDFKKRLLFF